MQNKSNSLQSQPQVRISPSGDVLLTLPGKQYKSQRCIGKIVGDTLHVERNPERHLFRRFNAYGFNYQLLKHGHFSRVQLRELPSGRTLETTRETILHFGKFLDFKADQLERQIFLSLSDFSKRPAVYLPDPPHAQSQSDVQQFAFAFG